MVEQDYLADLIKKAKEAKEEEAKAAAPLEKKPAAKALTKEEQAAEKEEEEEKRKSAVEKELEIASQKKLIESYGNVRIYKIPTNPQLLYVVPVARPTKQEKAVINTIKEAATRLVTISPYRIRDQEQKRAVYKQRILEILKNSPELHIPEKRFDFYAETVVMEMVGFGIIDPLVMDDNLEEIMVIGAKKPVYLFHRKYEMLSSNIEFYSDKEIIDLINRIARVIGRRVDISAPLLDARLPDGSRVNATIPPASVDGATLTIRKFKKDPYTIVDLLNNGTISSEAAAFLWLCVEGLGAKPANILISGGTGSGKTTTLNCLASFIPENERIITIEDTAELALPLKHWIRMEARPPGLEGKGELTLDILTKNSLRMRPDRIIVGEVRHDEAFTLFTAMNTGHDGILKGDSLIQLSDGRITEIGNFVEKVFKEKQPMEEGNFEFAETGGETSVPCLNKQTLKIENKRITHVWRKKTKEKLLKIRLSSGKQLCLSNDHPLYKISNGLHEINACETKAGDSIAVPGIVEINAGKELVKPYLVGLIYGDGHLGQETMQFVNKEESLLEEFGKEIRPLTQNKVSRSDYSGFSRINVSDKKLIREISAQYEMPIGNKTKTFRLTEKTLSAKDSEIAMLLQGLFDCESHVNLHANCIEFSTANKDLAKKMPMILTRFGIASTIFAQEKDGKGNTGPYFRVAIHGKDNLEKFREKICYRHQQKKKNLELLIEKSKESRDLMPNLSRAIKNARLEAGFTQTELGAMLGCTTRSSMRAYETSARAPSRKQLEKICGLLQTETALQLGMIAESDLRFEKIVSIEEELFEGNVYDLTVEGNHNYIANGVIVSNCLGTIHANSPAETIVRITSPPMNVPEVMLSGLDIIVIEHKIHDKRKGTIRRITEIAEVSGVLLRKAQTQAIFARDPARDVLERVNTPIKFLKVLQDFTGLNLKAIEDKWKERQLFLDKLQKQGIRGMEAVKKATQEFQLEGA